MTQVWYQCEFYSKLEQCWVSLGGKRQTEAEAQQALKEIRRDQRRIVRVTQTIEVISEA